MRIAEKNSPRHQRCIDLLPTYAVQVLEQIPTVVGDGRFVNRIIQKIDEQAEIKIPLRFIAKQRLAVEDSEVVGLQLIRRLSDCE